MLREKLELGAVALRVLSWVVIPNLRFSKSGKRKKKINTQLRGQTQADTELGLWLARGQAPREQMWVFVPPDVYNGLTFKSKQRQ